MPVRELAQLTWQEAGGTERDRTVVILPVGALEAHGPHLPVATDVWIAEAMARAGAEKLAARGMDVLLLPALALPPVMLTLPPVPDDEPPAPPCTTTEPPVPVVPPLPPITVSVPPLPEVLPAADLIVRLSPLVAAVG